MDYIQLTAIYGALNTDITGLKLDLTLAQQQAIKNINDEAKRQLVDTDFSSRLSDDERTILELVRETAVIYDPVEVTDLSGNQIDIGLIQAPEVLLSAFDKSDLFRKRMAQVAPYSYAVRAANKIMSAHGVHGLSMPLSPKIAIDFYFPMVGNGPPTPAELQPISERFGELHNQILQYAVDANELGVRAYQNDGRLRMVYQPLFEDDVRKGIIVYRPAIPTDKYTHSPLQQLAINYAAIRGNELLKGNSLEEFEEVGLHQENEGLRQVIKDEQKRFLGRRPIKFAMPPELRQMAGLISLRLRYNPREHDIKAVFALDDGEVELSLDRELRVLDDKKISLAYPGIRQYYENLVLKLAKKWMCTQEIHTSEGTVSERSGNSANMGHYAYLRIREDGRRYHFSETQRVACLEEQGKDLSKENERLKHLDPAGRLRNSTYVRENYDPAKPPLEVYYSELD